MVCLLKLLAISAAFLTLSLLATEEKSAYNPEFSKLVWADEFNGKGLPDASKWNYEIGYIRNKELQYYSYAKTENSRLENGKLVIEAHRSPDGKITSASLVTLGKFSFLYGRVEVRARVPQGLGTWPAIWMMGTDIYKNGWPKCGEIDILEQVGSSPTKFHANVHTYGSIKLDKNGKYAIKKGWTRTFENYADFHTYALEWTPDSLKFFYDEKFLGEYKKDPKLPDYWHFDKPMYLILNLAIGGAWGGAKGVDESIFPVKYEIDWVRYYNKKTSKN